MAFLWGISEGMTFIQFGDKNYGSQSAIYNYGIRSHLWIKKYHLIDGLVIIFAGVSGALLSQTVFSFRIILQIAGFCKTAPNIMPIIPPIAPL